MEIDLDKEIIEDQANKMYEDFIKRLQSQGISEELYYAYAGVKKEDILKDMEKEAETRVKYRYLLEAISREEKIEVSDKDAKEELKKMSEMYQMTEEELLKELGSLEIVKYDLAMRKAIELLKENN